MPSIVKLPRRWAAILGFALVAGFVVFACELPQAGQTRGTDHVEISPVAATISPNEVVDFTAVAFDAAQDTASVNITWSASGGVVTDRGMNGGKHLGQFKNGTCGDYQVTATAHPGSKTATSNVTVTCEPPPPPGNRRRCHS